MTANFEKCYEIVFYYNRKLADCCRKQNSWKRGDVTLAITCEWIRRYLIVFSSLLIERFRWARQHTRRKRFGSFFKCELPTFERSRDGPISPDGGLHESTSNVTNLAINFRRWRRLIDGLISEPIVCATKITSWQNISRSCEWWKSSD